MKRIILYVKKLIFTSIWKWYHRKIKYMLFLFHSIDAYKKWDRYISSQFLIFKMKKNLTPGELQQPYIILFWRCNKATYKRNSLFSICFFERRTKLFSVTLRYENSIEKIRHCFFAIWIFYVAINLLFYNNKVLANKVLLQNFLE